MDASKRRLRLHLASDSTGETLAMMARAAAARFPGVETEEIVHASVRSVAKVDLVLRALERRPGVALFTIIDPALRARLEEGCRALGAPCLAAMDALEGLLGRYLGAAPGGADATGAQHALDEAYFRRIAALDFALAHDDGLGAETLGDADVVLVGVSRTSKTPTCIYLAGRGVKAANVPLVPGAPPPESLARTRALVVGLTAASERLVEVRRNRFAGAATRAGDAYLRPDAVDDEAAAARALFRRRGWPTLDVTGRAVEEIAAAVMAQLAERREKRVSA